LLTTTFAFLVRSGFAATAAGTTFLIRAGFFGLGLEELELLLELLLDLFEEELEELSLRVPLRRFTTELLEPESLISINIIDIRE